MANALLLKPLPLIAVTASSTAAGYDPSYVGNDYLGVVWRSLAATSVDVIVDLGSDVLCDTAVLFGCDGANSAMTLKVFASTQAAGPGFSPPSWTGATLPFLAGSEMPTNGRGVAMWQAPASPPPAARYWLFRIGGLANGTASIGRLVLGKGLVLARNFALGAAFGVKDLGSVDFSRYGALLRKRGAKMRTVGISFSSIYKDEVEASVAPLLEQVGNTEPIALITDPAAHAMRQRRAYFGPMVGDIGVTWRKATLFQSQANLVSLA